MQLITLLAYIEAPPTLSSSGDTPAAAFIAQVAAYKHDDPPMVIDARSSRRWLLTNMTILRWS